MIVADTNLISYFVIEGPHTESARSVFAGDPLWIAPPLWRSEFLNVLAVSVRGGVLTERHARAAWRNALAIAVGEHEPNPSAVLRLAIRRNISAYDAQFLALAHAARTVLVTSDRKLVRADPGRAVLMSEFSSEGKG